ncbi:hypothetical protein D1872_323340 [compost metagenome]
MPHLNQFLIEGEQLTILQFLVPLHAFSTIRVCPAIHANLIAIVDTWCAEVGELEERR